MRFPLPFPFKGRSDNVGYTAQDEGTTREAVNVRGIDPVSGRIRGAQRSGLTFNYTGADDPTVTRASDQAGGNDQKVIHITSVTRHKKQTDYAYRGETQTESLEWSNTLPATGDCRNLAVDRQGNVYALDGSTGLVKYNSEGEELWKWSVPVEDDEHVIRALLVDRVDRIYVGVSAGGDQSVAAFWQLRQVVDDSEDLESCTKPTQPKVEVAWAVETGQYVEAFALREGLLYTIQNDLDLNSAELVVYQRLYSSLPDEAYRRKMPHPATDISVGKDGSIYVSADENSERAIDPRAPGSSALSQDWVPEDLKSFKSRIWAWYRAEDLQLEDGEPVVQWNDRSGNGRHLYAGPDSVGSNAPTYQSVGIGGRPSVRFDSSAQQHMESAPNAATTEYAYSNQQRTMLPAYDTQQFLVLVVFRAPQNGAVGTVFSQDHNSVTPNATPSNGFRLFSNRAASNAVAAGATNGKVSWFELIDTAPDDGGLVASGGDNVPQAGDVDADTDACVAVVRHMNGLQLVGGGDAQVGEVMSVFRVNGTPVDIWRSFGTGTSYISALNDRTFVGVDGVGGTARWFEGDIAEIIVLRDSDDIPDDTADLIGTGIAQHARLVCTSPPYPTLANAVTGTFSVATNYQNGPQVYGVTEIEALEAWAGHRYGLAHVWPVWDGSTTNPYAFYTLRAGPPRGDQDVDYYTGGLSADALFLDVRSPEGQLNSVWRLLAKFDATSARAKWVLTSEENLYPGITPANEQAVGGVGYACAASCDGNVFSVGPTGPVNVPASGGGNLLPDNFCVRKVIDQGDDYSIAGGDGAWGDPVPPAAAGDNFVEPNITIDVDEFDNVFIPYNEGTGTNTYTVIGYATDGTVILRTAFTDDVPAFAVRAPLTHPEYEGDLATKTHEFLYLATQAFATGEAIHKHRLVTATHNADTGRTRVNLVVGYDGSSVPQLRTFGVGDAVADQVTDVAGATFSTTTTWVDSTALLEQVFFTDGSGYWVYRWDDDGATEFVAYKPKSAGEMPKRCRLITNWRGRVVLAGSPDEPENWFMSAKGDPYNWDYFPPVIQSTQAIAGNLARAGRAPDIINALIPYNDDLLFFGGDHSVWRLTGDPMQGGELDLVSDITGMSFGRSWTKDPAGRIYFFGSRGGVYMIEGGGISRLSVHRIERTLQNVDLSTYFVELAWNYRDEGLHVFVLPYGAPLGVLVRHFFWEAKTDSWWEDEFGSNGDTAVQPTAVALLDGDDPDDRILILGCEDGYLRWWDRGSSSDSQDPTQTARPATVAIDSRVAIGPLHLAAEGREIRFTRFHAVLADDQSGAYVELFASDTPDITGAPRALISLHPGRNGSTPARARGSYVWCRLRNSNRAERWSAESFAWTGFPAGRERVRR